MTNTTGTKLVAHIGPEPPLTAEVLVEPQRVVVTLAVPTFQAGAFEVFFGDTVMTVVTTLPSHMRLIVPLPVAVQPDQFVVRFSHGVLDVSVERPSR